MGKQRGRRHSRRIQAETIITGHTNADFDCLAGIVAAGRLYPGAVLVFPGSQEKTLRNFYLQSAFYMFNFVPAKDIDPDSVKRLVAVDTRQRSRLPHISEVLNKPDLDIHLYDHHPDSDEDLKGSLEVVESWGSSAAIITLRIKETGGDLTPEEATVIGLGLYEDTGTLTFNSTTENDLLAAAWLRSKGMDLGVISDLLSRDLTAEQVRLLNMLLDNAQTHDINGMEVVLAEADSAEYVGDFALLAHKMMEMEHIRVLFAMGRMKDRITVVARSRSADVDVGRICESLGGGGHPYAASASIKNKTLHEVREELFALLYSEINPEVRLAAIMSSPPVTILRTSTIAEASEIMVRYGLKALPVLDREDGEVVGLIEHEVADKALSHHLGEVQVREYMGRDLIMLPPETDLYRAMELILAQRQRLVPVVDDGSLVGVVTRTDLINILVEEPARIPEKLIPERKRERSINGVLRDRLPEEVQQLLRLAGEMGEGMGYQTYVVGGFVRDLLLGKPNFDVDLVVEGDGIIFARRLAAELGGRVKAHQKFKTAVVILPDGRHVDVATARLEYYEYPAALPTVQLSSIKMDLYRRDFTVNALAVRINPESYGKLVDFFGAQRDLKDKVIRVLHSLSFVEDPTRILRAVRFEQRFGFTMGGQTERLIKSAVNMQFFQKLSGSRIFNELKLIFKERRAKASILRMEELGLWGQLHPDLRVTPKMREMLDSLEEVLDWRRLLYLAEPEPEPWKAWLLCLVRDLDADGVDALVERLSFSKRDRKEFSDLRAAVNEAFHAISRWIGKEGPLSELYFLLEKVPEEGVLYLMARSTREEIRKGISLYLSRLREEGLDIDGEDLKQLGVPPGPRLGEILRLVQAAKVDGRADCREEQLSLARRLVSGVEAG
ncbi:CBS domain-containing protein [Desulfohalovibrio reitneri]|uniref:CBS domain-containing protein n=1 Tax=Desulfohalovibrio reitneri TaxID=1307759 RepID=UPI0004A6E1F8|nr:CBS domain-containing protein [Desulfohalovibrio reitneri]